MTHNTREGIEEIKNKFIQTHLLLFIDEPLRSVLTETNAGRSGVIAEVENDKIRKKAIHKAGLVADYWLTTLITEKDKQKDEAVAVAVKADRERVTKLLADMVATKRERGGSLGNIISEANVNLTILNILTQPTKELLD